MNYSLLYAINALCCKFVDAELYKSVIEIGHLLVIEHFLTRCHYPSMFNQGDINLTIDT